MKSIKTIIESNSDIFEENAGDYNPFKIEGITFSLRERHGGGEGQGEEHWVVFSADLDGRTTYWQVPGYYMSYDGATLHWDQAFEVRPAEKKITVWEQA